MFKRRPKSRETSQLLLNTALALFRRKGFEGTTMRDIAAEAGLSLGAAYYYFDSKEAIVAAYYDYVQDEHVARSRAAFAQARDFRGRLAAAIHTKLDILREDRKLLGALFRYGGDPDHRLSWFGPGTRGQRELCMAVFDEAVGEESMPSDVRAVAPALLWALHMGLLLYYLFDSSPNQRRTRDLADGAVDLTVKAKRFVAFPLMRPIRKRVINLLREAELLPEPAIQRLKKGESGRN